MPRGERKTAHNRCPINFVIRGFPLTATITVVEGGWRPPREDVRARSSSSPPAARYFICATGSIVACTQGSYVDYRSFIPFISFLFRRSLFISFFSRPSLTIVSRIRTHTMTTYYTRTSVFFRNFFLCFYRDVAM